MITTEDPSGNGIQAFGLFDLCGCMDLRGPPERLFTQIAGKTKYKRFNYARNYAWKECGEPLFMRLYQDAESGKWNYHCLFPQYTSPRHRKDPGAVALTVQQVAAIVEGGRAYLRRLLNER